MKTDSAATDGVCTKGTSVAGMLSYVRAYWGESGVTRLAEATPLPAAGLVRSPPLASSWYPFEQFTALLDAGERLFAHPSTSFAYRQAAHGAGNDLRGVYRAFVRVASPAFLLARGAKLWRQYYNSGTICLLDTDGPHVLFELRDFATPHRGHCDAVLGWCARASELTGVRRLRAAHTACRARGDARCSFHLEWD